MLENCELVDFINTFLFLQNKNICISAFCVKFSFSIFREKSTSGFGRWRTEIKKNIYAFVIPLNKSKQMPIKAGFDRRGV